MAQDHEFLITRSDGAHHRIAPTDISGFLRTGQCRRFLRLRLYERAEGRKAFEEFGAPLQTAPQMLTRAGEEFEAAVYADIDRSLRRIDFAKVSPGGGRQTPDNHQVATLARDLANGESLILTQPRLEAALGEWILTGLCDLIRLRRSETGLLEILIVDIKKSAAATVEHKLQVAFYHEMLAKALSTAGIAFGGIGLGILYEGSKHPDDSSADEIAEGRRAAKKLFGTDRAILERVEHPRDYIDAIRDLVVGNSSIAKKVITTPFDQLPFHLSYVCDSCQYNAYCMKWSALNDDLSLIPYLTQSEKAAFHRNGIDTTSELAQVKELVQDESSMKLVTPPDCEPEVARLVTSWAIGSRLDEFIHRARQYRRHRKDAIEALSYIPESGYGSLPYCDATQHPNLIRIYLDAQHDYVTDRVYLLGALISAAEQGAESSDQHRSVVHLTQSSPDDVEEASLFERWIVDVLQAVADLASPAEDGQPNAPIHLIFFDELTQKRLLAGLGRHATTILSATPLYDFVTQMAAFDSSLITFLDGEIAAQKNYPILCQTLMSISGYRQFDWTTPLRFRNLFRRGCFDSQMKLDQDEYPEAESAPYYTGRARFSSLIPLEYAYAAWGELRQKDPDASYAGITPDILIAFERRRLEAMEFIAKDLKENRDTTKTSFHLPELGAFESTARSLAHALDEFVIIERHVDLAEWKRQRLATPEKRVLAGQTLVVRYLESDQLAGVSEQIKENARRAKLHQEMKQKFEAENPGKKFIRSKEQIEATKTTQEGLVVRLRFDATGWECGLDEAIHMTKLGPRDSVVLRERWTYDSRLPVEEQKPLTPTPKQLLYGERARFKRIAIDQSASGSAQQAFAEIELQDRRGGGSGGFLFSSHSVGLENSVSYTIDPSPDDYFGFWEKKVTEGLVDGGKNALYERLSGERTDSIDWPQVARDAQNRFLSGFEELRKQGHFHGFEESKQTFISKHGATPVLLVQGPPGTGKSFTTAFAVFALIQGSMAAGLDLRILLSCKTHAATDVLLENVRLVKEDLKLISTRFSELFRTYFDERLLDVPLFRFQPRGETVDGVIPLQRASNRPKDASKPVDVIKMRPWAICAGTPGGIYGQVKDLAGSKSLFGFQIFDTLVLDEASQMGLPEAIMASLPLKLDGRLIVVGDPRQLPPIIKHDWENEARRSFKEYKSYRSLFETLLEREPPPPIIQFQESFRLHTDMAEFLRREIYSRDGIAFHSKKNERLELVLDSDQFVAAVLDPDHPIVIVAHGEATSQVANDFEQSLVKSIGDALARQPREAFDAISEVGVVVPHRKQRAALQQLLPELSQIDQSFDEPRGSAIDTVERFQGGERTLILISATESDPQFLLSTSEFILDPRRLTVALSRAKKKLILVASESIFQFFSADETVFENAQIWKNLLRRTCTELLWEGDRDGHRVRVWGNLAETPRAVLDSEPVKVD